MDHGLCTQAYFKLQFFFYSNWFLLLLQLVVVLLLLWLLLFIWNEYYPFVEFEKKNVNGDMWKI